MPIVKRTKALRVAVIVTSDYQTACWLEPYQKVAKEMIVLGRASTPKGFMRMIRSWAKGRKLKPNFWDRVSVNSFYKPEV